VIVTALAVETSAVLRQLGDTNEEVFQGTVFHTGTFENRKVHVVEVGEGNVAAAAIGERAISHFKADIALFVGVAGGVKDVALGDVVVASKVYGYERGKDKANEFLPRPDVQVTDHALEQRARAMTQRKRWHKRLNPSFGERSPNLFVGKIAAGEKVVAASRSATAKFLEKHYGDTLAVEMEGRGFLEAVHISPVKGTVIRGISDRLSGKTTSDKAGWQKKAADAASAVAFELLTSLAADGSSVSASAIPNFSVEFVSDREVHAGIPVTFVLGGQLSTVRGTYVHLRIVALINVDRCEATITCLEKLGGSNDVLKRQAQTRDLVWAPRELGERIVSIMRGAPRDLDIFRTIENKDKLELLSVGHPFSWDSFFDDAGRYRLTINIVGDGVNREVRLLIDWRGRWDDFDLTLEPVVGGT
jgi:nucleoside phosphorylase